MGDEHLEAAVLAFLSLEEAALPSLEAEAAALAGWLDRLPELEGRLRAQRDGMIHNATFLRSMLLELDLIHPDTPANSIDAKTATMSSPASEVANACTESKSLDCSNVIGVLRQMVREWSDVGEQERSQAFGPLTKALQRYLPVARESAQPCVLVPGAGLGRLAFDLATEGYSATGVESSYLMLVPAWFILQRLIYARRNDARIYPFAHEPSNVQAAANLSRSVELPGEPGWRARPEKPLSIRLLASSFEALCADAAHAASWDAVATCFFLDACANALETIDGIARVLKPGGVWVSTGPLLFHHAKACSEGGRTAARRTASGVPKLCADELLLLVERSGFEVLESSVHAATYCDDPLSMCRAEYMCRCFAARRTGRGTATRTDEGRSCE